jgi:phosphatidate cytidylyltransferase
MSQVLPTKWNDLGVRIASALVLAPLALAALWFGGYWYSVFIILMGIMIAREWTAIVFPGDEQQFLIYSGAALIAGTINLNEISFLLVPFMASLLCVALKRKTWSVWNILGVGYVALPILAFMMLRNDAAWGFKAVCWCMIIVWSADTLAYFFGRIIGGPKLAPVLSPKKTWAGLAGAVVGAALASVVFSYYAGIAYLPLAALAAQFAVVEQAGDIFESALKRSHSIKDSGHLIPGHGGVLDRADGLLAVVLIAFILAFLHNPTHPAMGLLSW